MIKLYNKKHGHLPRKTTMKKKTAQLISVILVLAISCCILFACSQSGDDVSQPAEPDTPSESEIRSANMSAKEGVEYGEDIEIEYDSVITGAKKHAMVTLPKDYTQDKSYPVLYLLHGINCDHHAWLDDCNAKYIVQNLVNDGKAQEMIIVSVNSIVTEDEVAPSISDETYAPMFDLTGNEIATSLMPYVNSHFSTLTDKQNTAVAGFSMGGREALLTAFAHQELFDYVGAFSSSGFADSVVSYDTTVPDFRYDEGQSFELVMLAIGNFDMWTGIFTPAIKAKFDENGVEYVSRTYVGIHSYSVWKNALYDFVQELFKQKI